MGSFTEGLRTGSKLVQDARVNERQQRQQQLTEISQGQVYDPNTQQFNPTQQRKSQQELINLDLQAKLDAVNLQLESVSSTNNLNSMNTITTLIANNNYADARKEFSKNPVLKQKFAEGNFNVVDFQPINMAIDTDLLRNSGLYEKFKKAEGNPEAMDAMTSLYFKTQDRDGNWNIKSTDQLMKGTNYYNNLQRDQQNEYTQRSRNISAILKGAGLTPQEEDLKEDSVEMESLKTSIMSTAITTGDATKVMEALSLTNPELFLKAQGDPNARRDSLKQMNVALERAGVTEEHPLYQQIHAQFATKIVAGTKEVKEQGDVAKVKASTKTVDEVKNKAQDTELTTMTALKGTNKGQYDLVTNDIKTMNANYQLGTNLKKLLDGEAEDINVDMVASVKDKAAKWFGYTDEQTLKNANFQSKGGALLATYILSRSGTAASDVERQFLQDLMLSGSLDDETYVRNAMKSFYESLSTQNNTLGDSIKTYAPDSSNKFRLQTKKAVSAADFD